MKQQKLVLSKILLNNHMLQPNFKWKLTQQRCLYVHIMDEVHGSSSSFTAQAVQKLFT